MKLKTTAMLVALVSGALISVANAADDKGKICTPPQAAQNSVYDSMVGEWEGVNDYMGNKMKETMDIKWDLNHQFLIVELKAQSVDQPNNTYQGLGMFGLDKKGKAKTWWFDSWGAPNVATGIGTFKDNSLVLVGSNQMSREVRTFTVNGDKMTMTAKGTAKMPDGKKMKYDQNVTYTKD